MPNDPRILLSTADVDILLSIAERGEGCLAYRNLLRRRLEAATILMPWDMPGNVVTIDSRFVYRIDDRDPLAAIAVQSPPHGLAEFALSIRTMRGLALLGLAEGSAVTIDGPDGRRERLTVERMLHRPEPEARDLAAHSAIRQRWYASLGSSAPSPDGQVLPFRQKQALRPNQDPDGGNPGPDAA
jgi:regulator of nucleoside diphosphate kinase